MCSVLMFSASTPRVYGFFTIRQPCIFGLLAIFSCRFADLGVGSGHWKYATADSKMPSISGRCASLKINFRDVGRPEKEAKLSKSIIL
jgi:hypothetical protein